MASDAEPTDIPLEPVDHLSRVGREILRLTVLENVDLPTAMSAAFPGAPPSRSDELRNAALAALSVLIAWRLVRVRSHLADEGLLSGSGTDVVERLSARWEEYSTPASVDIECTPRGWSALKEYALRHSSECIAVVQASPRVDQTQISKEEADILSQAVSLLDRLYVHAYEAWKND